ncbi:transcriptional regulator ATRX homolog isoform X4 [Zophobas morio]|uniref:transcriptional regulator ATRX homolog isoform X4 n=1 Tax=Zophobas morio TaxID=2755281 RepID=UPI0030830E8D
MSDPLQTLQKSFADVLKDLMSMSASVIRKSNTYLNDAELLRQETVSSISTNIQILLDRVNTNVSAFKNTFDTAISDYEKSASLNERPKDVVSPTEKANFSLEESAAAAETDVDLTPDEEQAEPPKSDKNSKQGSSATVEKNGDAESGSDTDSEKSVRNFDVPVTNGSVGGLSDGDESGDEFTKALDALDKQDDKTEEPTKERVNGESQSFDFDDIDDDLIAAELDKFEKNKEMPSDAREQVQKDNHELLDLLNKAIGEGPVTEKESDEALRILENEISLSSLTDSDESMKSDNDSSDDGSARESDNDSSDDWKPETSWKERDSESEKSRSDSESSTEEEEPQFRLKTFDIKLDKRLDDMDDDEIANLCNTHTINKRRCVKEIHKIKRKKRKRIRVISSSSSSTSSDSVTPDLALDQDQNLDLQLDLEIDRPPSVPNEALPDVTALADELVDLLDDEDDDDDIDIDSDISDTSSDLESKNKDDEEKPKNEEPEIQEIKSDDEVKQVVEVERPEKKKGSWRNEIFFDTSSESEDEDEPVVVLNDPLERADEDEDEDKKEKLQIKIKTDGEAVVITDSEGSNSDSDDVTFVDEVTSDENAGRGRRNIRAILSDDELNELTQKAKYEEDERIQRIEEHSKAIDSIQSQREDFVLDVDVQTGNPLITVDYHLTNMLKPHQKDGVKFMWQACYESVDILKSKPGTGCILAHCMGLGKTLQVITLIHTLFTHGSLTQTKHVLITCPLSTVTNWKNEFKKAFRQLNDDRIRRYFIVKGDVVEKIRTVRWWRQNGGVLVMGYEAFQRLTSEKLSPRVTPEQRKAVLEALTNPGPDLIVCDEGHLLKNSKTLRFNSLIKVKTKRRIVLTGTPLQNNLKEYYVMVEFVKPHLLGTKEEYKNRFATPIENGQYHDSRPEDIKLMKKRTHVLTKLLKKTIHRVEAAVLSSYLPEIVDYTICLKLTPLQMEMYTKYINMTTGQSTELGKKLLTDVMMLNFNNLHPYTIQLYYNKPKHKKKKRKRTEEGATEDDEQEADVSHVSQDWFKVSLPEDVNINVNYSAKLKLVFDILNECLRVKEKVLIFVQFLVELDIIENFLKYHGTENQQSWRPNVDYYRMDGKTPVDDRDTLCRRFNTDATAKLFILTHRVGGLGLNLVGANRVIMIGSNYNPSLDTQSMYRVYRFGQTKKCYVYRLLSMATMEEKIYQRCVVKLHLSGTVVDKLHFVRRYTSSDLRELYKVDFSEYTVDRPIPIVPTDKLLAQLVQNTYDIYRYHLHNSLLENRPEEELTDEDKKMAWDEFNNMEEAAKPLPQFAPPVVVNPIFQLPIFPAHMSPAHRGLRVYLHPRTNGPTLVPNPMNNNARGFLPRVFLPNGMRPQVSNRVVQPASNFLHLFDQTVPGRLSGHNAHNRFQANFPATELLQNLRENIAQVLREQPLPSGADEAPSAEFNYALNKVV